MYNPSDRKPMNNQLDLETVKHIARLSRIELAEDQLESMRNHMAHILEYFDKLQELDTDDIEPFTHAVDLRNVFAQDVETPSLPAEEVLSNAPDRVGNLFKVPKVLGDS
jgi:aspartyl-tRNA(Asn)/glutamyl-tRNA(Gln) amidotransferase subunit C